MAKTVTLTNSKGVEAKTVKSAAPAKEKKAKATATGGSPKAKAELESAMPARKVNRILITQPRPDTDKSPYFDLARKYQIELEFYPFIRVEGVGGRDFRRQRVDVSEYTAIIFTSRSAVDHFFRIMEEMKVKVSQEMKY